MPLPTLIQYSTELAKRLNNIADASFTILPAFNFNTRDLLEYVDKETSKNCQLWRALHQQIAPVTGPVLYWFAMPNPKMGNEEIFSTFRTFKKSNPQRNAPACANKYKATDTRVLYVGCCTKTRFFQRIFWHTGYYHQGKTQGLQLCHWTRGLSLDLQLNAIQLPEDLSQLTTLYEKRLAIALKPLLGSHRD